MHEGFLEIRLLGGSGKAEQAGDLADALHNLPKDMWHADFSLQLFRDSFLGVYQRKYPVRMVGDYVKMVDEIIAMKDRDEKRVVNHPELHPRHRRRVGTRRAHSKCRPRQSVLPTEKAFPTNAPTP
jgi:hypothetical protein